MNAFKKLGAMTVGITLGMISISATAQSTNAAKNYPERPITIVVPYTPGGSVDTVARIVTAQLQKQLNQPIVIDNKPGGSGVIGTSTVSRANPDGYTLLLHASSQIYLPIVSANAKYDPIKEFSPIARIGTVPLLVVTKADAPYNTLQELKAYQEKHKDSKDALTWATSGYGTSSHLTEEMLNHELGLGMQIIAYKGAASQLNDVVAGHVSAAVSPMPGVYPFVTSGRLKALAVTSAERAEKLPNVPTVAESGLKDFDFSSWYGIWAPAGLPPEISAKLSAEIQKAMQSEEVKKAFEAMMFEIVQSSPEDLAKVQLSEQKLISDLAKKSNITVQ